MTETVHFPVMCHEVVQLLKAEAGGAFIDCTLGGAGHSEALLKANARNKVVSIDRDTRAIDRARIRLASYESRVELHWGNFGSVVEIAQERVFDGMVVDLGISTDQLRENRGFSFHDSAPLDMRMNEQQEFSAHDVVNSYSEKELLLVLKRGGVGKEAFSVARGIVAARPIKTTGDLSSAINRAAAGITSKKSINPSTVVFQAIRIEVNREFDEIEKMLDAAPAVVRTGGRLAVITFHSLEDRLVTHRMREWQQGDSAPASWRGPRIPSKGKLISTKPVVPGDEEVAKNPPSRSARLRVFEFGA